MSRSSQSSRMKKVSLPSESAVKKTRNNLKSRSMEDNLKLPPIIKQTHENEKIQLEIISSCLDTTIELQVLPQINVEFQNTTNLVAPKIYLDGLVKLLYEMYNEDFMVKAGSISQEEIDDLYCFSTVMPNCTLKLSIFNPIEIREKIINSTIDESTYIPEDPKGHFHTLEVGKSYYIYVTEDSANEETKQVFPMLKEEWDQSDGRGFKSCTCIYGTPCLDEFGCIDWKNRFAVAQQYGWKGF